MTVTSVAFFMVAHALSIL